IKAGLKGRSYHDEILNSGRPPRERGLKAWKGRVVKCLHLKRIAIIQSQIIITIHPLFLNRNVKQRKKTKLHLLSQ
ncbi:MAG: hypothetical protein WAK17_16610, partial [Candidatus Nitrosopolaris sp.]